MRNPFPVLLILSLCVVSCATRRDGDAASFEKAPLFGMIYDEENQPCAGARLAVDGTPENGQTGLVTDIRGRFVLSDLSRGEHSVAVRKEGFEDLSVRIQFLNRTDVLFLRMVSYSQLLTDAEKALDERKWDRADEFLARAQKLDAGRGDAVLLFIRAVRACRTEKPDEAVSLLNAILAEGNREPSVFLFLADIYEKHLNDRGKAAEYLEAFLALRGDAEVEKRLSELKGRDEEN